jgi:hypothetical protein
MLLLDDSGPLAIPLLSAACLFCVLLLVGFGADHHLTNTKNTIINHCVLTTIIQPF